MDRPERRASRRGGGARAAALGGVLAIPALTAGCAETRGEVLHRIPADAPSLDAPAPDGDDRGPDAAPRDSEAATDVPADGRVDPPDATAPGCGGAVCAGVCVDLATDGDHCGACDTACATGVGTPANPCAARVCHPVCAAGFGDCDGVPVNGCETPLTAATHCGACGVACGVLEVCAAGACRPVAPRALAPLSTATVTSRRPTLRWALPPGADGARVELCRDRDCARGIATLDVTGTRAAPAVDLPRATVFWRLRARTGAVTGAVPGPTWQFVVGARTAAVDTAWGTTLDVNGDGYADLAVGAPGALSGRGAAYVYLGGATGLATAPAARLDGPDGGGFGTSVTSAGDVNGDGYADLAVGAPDAPGGGRAYVYLGGATGLATAPTTLADPAGAGGRFGAAVASAGDVDHDGFADLVVGAPDDLGLGRAYVYLGSATGLATAPAVTLASPAGPGGSFGAAVASVGDTTGNGFADLVVSAPGAVAVGRAYVYLASATGLAAVPRVLSDPTDPGTGHFGYAVVGPGDVDGDGRADLVVGAPDAPSHGQAYLYLGSATGLAPAPTTLTGAGDTGGDFGYAVAGAGDVNGDGYADVVVGAPGAGSAGSAYVYLGTLTGLAAGPGLTLPATGDSLGNFGASVAGAGDLDGDGYADLAVGAFGASAFQGRAYVFSGSPTGPRAVPMSLGIAGEFGWSVARRARPASSARFVLATRR